MFPAIWLINSVCGVEWLPDDAPHAAQEDRALRFILEEKPNIQRRIAGEFCISFGRISQIFTALREAVYLSYNKHDFLKVIAKGYQRLAAIWPELSDHIEWRHDLDI